MERVDRLVTTAILGIVVHSSDGLLGSPIADQRANGIYSWRSWCAAQAGGGTPDAAVLAGLRSVRDALRAAGATLKRMPERCNDAEFYSVVRPFLQGWPAGGVVYAAEGSAQTHQGASGAQSSLLPAVDAWLGVRHARKASVALRRSMPENTP